MIYLKIDFINNMNIQLFVKNILMKIKNDSNQYLRLLSIHVSAKDDHFAVFIQNLGCFLF